MISILLKRSKILRPIAKPGYKKRKNVFLFGQLKLEDGTFHHHHLNYTNIKEVENNGKEISTLNDDSSAITTKMHEIMIDIRKKFSSSPLTMENTYLIKEEKEEMAPIECDNEFISVKNGNADMNSQVLKAEQSPHIDKISDYAKKKKNEELPIDIGEKTSSISQISKKDSASLLIETTGSKNDRMEDITNKIPPIASSANEYAERQQIDRRIQKERENNTAANTNNNFEESRDDTAWIYYSSKNSRQSKSVTSSWKGSNSRREKYDDYSNFTNNNRPTNSKKMKNVNKSISSKRNERYITNKKSSSKDSDSSSKRGNPRSSSKSNQSWHDRHNNNVSNKKPSYQKEQFNERRKAGSSRAKRKTAKVNTKSDSFFSTPPYIILKKTTQNSLSYSQVLNPQQQNLLLNPVYTHTANKDNIPNTIDQGTIPTIAHHPPSNFNDTKYNEEKELYSLLDRVGLTGASAAPLVCAIKNVDSLERLSGMELSLYGLSADQRAYLSILLAERRNSKQRRNVKNISISAKESLPALFGTKKSGRRPPFISTSSILEASLCKEHERSKIDTDKEDDSRIEAELQELGGQMIASILD